jgi:hypothetical protein
MHELKSVEPTRAVNESGLQDYPQICHAAADAIRQSVCLSVCCLSVCLLSVCLSVHRQTGPGRAPCIWSSADAIRLSVCLSIGRRDRGGPRASGHWPRWRGAVLQCAPAAARLGRGRQRHLGLRARGGQRDALFVRGGSVFLCVRLRASPHPVRLHMRATADGCGLTVS